MCLKRSVLVLTIVVSFVIGVLHSIAGEPSFPFPPVHNGRLNPTVVRGAMGSIVTTFTTRITGGYRIGMAISNNNGSTWRVIDSVSSSRAGLLGLQRRPTGHQTSDGTLICSYEDQKVGDVMPKVYVARSTDNGYTWSATVSVVRGPQAPMQDFSSMAVGANGLVVVSFISADSVEPGRHVWIVRSTDHGTSWSLPIRANRRGWIGKACECCMTGVAIAPDGTVCVAFRANRSNVRDIHAAFSSDGGLTFSDPKLVQDSPWNIQGCPSTGPSITFDGSSKAHLSWRDYRDTAERSISFYATLRSNSVGVPVNMNISSQYADDSEYPSVCVSDDGRFVHIFFESSNGLRLNTSVDYGATFTSSVLDELVKSNASAHIVALPAGRALAVWMGERNGVFDVKMQNEGSPTAIEDEPAVGEFDMQQKWLTIDEQSSVLATDLLGRPVDVREDNAGVRRIFLGFDQPTLLLVRNSKNSNVFLVDRSLISVSVKP